MVHGAWHSPEHFGPLVKYLNGKDYKCRGPKLPCVHFTDPDDVPKDLKPDIQVIRQAIVGELDSGKDVLLVAHSYGAVPAVCAVEGLDTESRKAKGEKSSVIGIVVIAALLLNQGVSVFEIGGRQYAPPQDVRGSLMHVGRPGPAYYFYNDLPPDQAIKWESILRPQAWLVNEDPLPFAGHKVVPTTYLICERDNALPPFWQRLLIDTVRKEGIELRAETCQSGHSPFLSMVEATGDFLRRCAGEKDVDNAGFGTY